MKKSKLSQKTITAALKTALQPLPYVYAFWLEGADAAGCADEYSDIDYWLDIADEYEEAAIEAVEAVLMGLAPLDFRHVMEHDHPKLRQRIYHLSGTSEYLMIDFCWQLHSRPKSEYCYIKGDRIEAASVIFDKDEVVRWREFSPGDYAGENERRLAEAQYRFSQHCRVTKYIRRGEYLEALAQYNRYVLEALVDVLRILYTPAHTDYGMVHISRHLPQEAAARLEWFARVSSFEDIEERVAGAGEWFASLRSAIKN